MKAQITTLIVAALLIAAPTTQATELDLSQFGGEITLLSPTESNNLGTTGAEYGSGPIFLVKIHYKLSHNWRITSMHKSYPLTGSPFNNEYESTFSGLGISYTWGAQ